MKETEGVEVTGQSGDRYDEILTPEALGLVAALQRELGPRRAELLAARARRQDELSAGAMLDFLADTRAIREDDSWRVSAPAPGLVDRRVEITGPTDKKMTINALNSGAKVWLADFEDANTPLWDNMVTGQLNLADALDRKIDYTSEDGKAYQLLPADQLATIVVRPRGWHLDEKHLLVDGQRVSGSLFDFGMYFANCARRQLAAGKGPYFYLAKLESHLEARLWNDAFNLAQDALGIPRGTIRATVLIETIPAAFEMEEILYELREHSAGLNAGRWDYMFSIIKKFRTRGREFLLPGAERGDHDRAVHARLHRAAGQHLPRPRRARDRRDGRVHPEQARPGSQRQGAGQGPRRQGQGVQGRIRRILGGAPGPGPGLPRDIRRGARQRAEPAGQAAR